MAIAVIVPFSHVRVVRIAAVFVRIARIAAVFVELEAIAAVIVRIARIVAVVRSKHFCHKDES